MANRYKPSFTWDYGDPVNLKFYLRKIKEADSVDVSGWRLMAETVGFGAVFGSLFGGNQSDIPFMDIAGNTEEKKVLIEFYNSDFEKIYSDVVFGSDIISIDMDTEISASVFYRGVFYCSLKILDSEDKVEKTVLNSQDCSLYVR